VLGVDPGIGGALALLDFETKAVKAVFDMPVTDGKVDPAKLAGIIEMCKIQGSIRAAVELVSSMPRQAGAFNFGVSAGVVHGVLGALGLLFTLVPPSVWKNAMGLHRILGETQADVKSRAREVATKLWPERVADFKRIKDDGRAEACLIARYFANKTEGKI